MSERRGSIYATFTYPKILQMLRDTGVLRQMPKEASVHIRTNAIVVEYVPTQEQEEGAIQVDLGSIKIENSFRKPLRRDS